MDGYICCFQPRQMSLVLTDLPMHVMSLIFSPGWSSHITQILLPVLHRHHWSVYCVNFDQSRIDVLDSRVYNSEGDASWDMHHSSMGKTIMQRLSDALSKAAPHKFPSFRNWRHVQVVVPLQKCPTDDPFFAMKFLEFYDGDGHGSLKCTIDGVSHSMHFHSLGAFISYF